MKVVALDPGGTTGWAEYDDSVPEGTTKFNQKQIGPQPHHHALWVVLHETAPDLLVCESFMYQRRDKVVLVSVEYIGIATLYARVHDIPITMQSPSQAKNLWTDDKLKKLGLWTTNAPHAMDATRHLLYYLTVTLGDDQFVRALR